MGGPSRYTGGRDPRNVGVKQTFAGKLKKSVLKAYQKREIVGIIVEFYYSTCIVVTVSLMSFSRPHGTRGGGHGHLWRVFPSDPGQRLI